jgi:hypothetical protein
MASSVMLRRVALVRTDVSEASFIRVTRIGELGTTLAVTSNRRSVCRLLVTATVAHLYVKERFCNSASIIVFFGYRGYMTGR